MKEIELKQFMFGLSVLETYIDHCKPLNFQDISILSEDFCCDLMNSLYDFHLVNQNNTKPNNPGYDLISRKEKIIIQVTTVADNKFLKVKETLEALRTHIEDRIDQERELASLKSDYHKIEKKKANEDRLRKLNKSIRDHEADLGVFPNVKGYKLFFIFLCGNTNDIQKYYDRHKIEEELTQFVEFDYKTNIYDVDRFIQNFKAISPIDPQFNAIKLFMDSNEQIFIPTIRKAKPKKNKVQAIINGYSVNFIQPLFQHVYSDNKEVTLQNLYVDPLFICGNSEEKKQRDFLKIYDDFLRKNPKGRILFLEGDAAIGKTSLVSWLCYYYNQRDNTEEERSPLGGAIYCDRELVCIRLRDFVLDTPETILSALHNYFNVDPDDFQNHYAEAVFILDGVDELKFQIVGQDANNAEAFISNFRKLFPKAKFVITSRPLYINKELLNSDIYDYQTVTLSHYTKGMRAEWVENFCKSGEFISDETKDYILELDDGAADGVADTPLALYLLSSCDMKDDMRDNHWFLYHNIFHNAIVKTEYNESIKLGEGNSHPLSNKIDIIYPLIGEIAYRMYQQSKESISNDELKEIIRKVECDGLTSARIEKLCLLCSYWAKTDHQSVIEFYHNNIRDFFLAEFIYAKLHERKSTETNAIPLDKLISLFCDYFCYTKIASTTWEQAFSFLYLHFRHDLHESGENYTLFSQITQSSIKVTIESLLNSDVLWEKAHSGKYQCVKTIFYNYYMFIQIIYEESFSKGATNDELFNFNLSDWQELFNDWYAVYTQRIKISNELSIGSGSYTLWSNCEHYGKILDNAYFHSAIFENVSFKNTSLKKVIFINSELRDVNFTNVELSEVTFSNTRLCNVTFSHSFLNGVKFHNTTIQNCRLKSIDLSGAEFSDSKLYEINLNNQKIDGKITNCDFCHCELKRAKIKNSISNSRFANCDLSSIDMNGIELSCNEFINSELSHAQLYGSKKIYKCVISGGSINYANFNDSVLWHCKFIKTDLTKSEFKTSKIINTLFNNTRLNSLALWQTYITKRSYDAMLKQEALLQINQFILVRDLNEALQLENSTSQLPR